MSRQTLSRRSLMAGLTAAGVALPTFTSRRALAAPKKRFLVLFSPNGTIVENWRCQGTGSNFELSPILKPLEKYKSKMLVLDGISHHASLMGPGDNHMKGMGCWLTARPLLPGNMKGMDGEGAGLASGPSIDQELAKSIGTGRFKSYEFGMFCELVGQWDVLTRMIYADANLPLPPIDSPDKNFANLFANFNFDTSAGPADADALKKVQRTRVMRKSVFDHVCEDLKRLEGALGKDDRVRMQQHCDQLRRVEMSLLPSLDAAGPSASCKRPETMTLNLKDHNNHRTVSRLQSNMIAAAFACDLTRVASMQWNRSSGGAQFPGLGINEGHHDISHVKPEEAMYTSAVDKLTKINIWYAEEVAYLLDRLEEAKEADGSSVLDNTLVMWGNELCLGHTHTHGPSVPTVLFGGGAGFKMGRNIAFGSQTRSNADLYVSILQAFGVDAKTFGDPRYNKGPIAELHG